MIKKTATDLINYLYDIGAISTNAMPSVNHWSFSKWLYQGNITLSTDLAIHIAEFYNIAHLAKRSTRSDIEKLLRYKNQFLYFCACPTDEGLLVSVITEELLEFLAQIEILEMQIIIATPQYILQQQNLALSREANDWALNHLITTKPENSAYMQRRYYKILILAIVALLALLSFLPTIFTTLIFLTSLVYKITLFLLTPTAEPPNIELSDNLPIYTIIIPLYKETGAVGQLIRMIHQMNYPRHLLDIKLAIESDDEETRKIAAILSEKFALDIIEVPYSEPRTKPKACNYALYFAVGEMVTIYDAEDLPESNQLIIAYNAIHGLDAVQARLACYNNDENILAACFATEYKIWFDYIMPTISHFKLPIPLGGTSNHFYKNRLIASGGWDPYNVTEDADLGMRMAAAGSYTSVINSQTLEEAPLSISSWLKQRTRWIKGYMQTYVVHFSSFNLSQPKNSIAFQMLIGMAFFNFLLMPLALITSFNGSLVPLLSASLILSAIVLFVWKKEQQRPCNYFLVAIIFPFYYILHTIAAYMALYQLITRPFYWNKTLHGVSSYTNK